MKLFDFAYCGNYNDSIASLSVLVPEKWSFGNQNNNGILKNYIEHTFGGFAKKAKLLKKTIVQFLTLVYLIHIINQYAHTLLRIELLIGKNGI